jgi:hypothetical protein
MIIGGQAVLLYGSPRLTKDIDITLGVSTEKLPLLLNIIKETGLKAIPENPEKFAAQTSVLPAEDRKSGIRVDFIFSFTPYEKQAIKRAREVNIEGVLVKFAKVEDIVIHKIFSGRARDVEDVRIILIKNPDCDLNYIRAWLKEFEKSVESKDFLGTLRAIIKSLK